MKAYSSFTHLVASICPGRGQRYLFAMLRMPHTVYVDDSGTDTFARIVVAAYCVSSVRNWKEFERRWRRIARESGFEHFHMTAFASCRKGAWCRDCNKGKTTAKDHPWREWDDKKRERVLHRLACTVERCVQHGAGIAIAKEDYEKNVVQSGLAVLAPEAAGKRYFTFAIQACGGNSAKWRKMNNISVPLKFVFDLCDKEQREENVKYFFSANPIFPPKKDGIEQWFVPDGIAYESRKNTVQLLAADMLAWTSAKIRVWELFGTMHPDALTVGLILGSRNKLRFGSVYSNHFKDWADKELAMRKAMKNGETV